jgi:fructose-1,6-bisphosphatase II
MAEFQGSRNIGLDLVRVTETTALAAGRWVGLGSVVDAHKAATDAMVKMLNTMDIDGRIVVGEESRLGDHSELDSGMSVGSGRGTAVDVVLDPIDGTALVVKGYPGAISVVGVANRGAMWTPPPGAAYMNKIVVDREAAHALVPECLHAPAGWTLALVARVKKKPVRDLMVIVLDRPRHQDLINEIRAAGARVLLRSDGDAEGALVAATAGTGADILMGIGGVPEGVIAACAVKALGGAMIASLAPQSDEEREALQTTNFDMHQILTANEMVAGDDIYFAATGITDSVLLKPVRYNGPLADTDSLLLRTATRTRRFIQAEHILDELENH